jgi:hypothetical protein
LVTVILTIELEIPGIGSLKEKRRIIKSLLARVKNKFNVSIAEVGNNDILRNATLGAAIVSNDISFGQSVISKLVNKIESNPEVVIIDYRTENY